MVARRDREVSRGPSASRYFATGAMAHGRREGPWTLGMPNVITNPAFKRWHRSHNPARDVHLPCVFPQNRSGGSNETADATTIFCNRPDMIKAEPLILDGG